MTGKLDSLLSGYGGLDGWERRKDSLRRCMISTVDYPLNPQGKSIRIIRGEERKHRGYSVQNIAIETLPGLFVCGSLYRPAGSGKRFPVVVCPNGHFPGGRYRPDQQALCASLARMGALAFSYDLFGWGESRLQVKMDDHYTSTAMLIQTWNSGRIMDFLIALNDVDSLRIAMTGASGGGSQTMLMTALDTRIKVSVPVVMLSADFPGGCPCETGVAIHGCGRGTNNAEIAAMAAPRAQLIVSVGKDWTKNVPRYEFPYLQKVYEYYGDRTRVENVHLENEDHDYGFSKRKIVYEYLSRELQLNIDSIKNASGAIDESGIVIEPEEVLLVFGKNGGKLPVGALKTLSEIKTQIAAGRNK